MAIPVIPALALAVLAGVASSPLPAEVEAPVVYNGPIVTVNPAPQAWTGVAPVQPAAAFPAPAADAHEQGLSLGGPRFGISYISGGGFDKLLSTVKKSKPDAELEPVMSQFGWQAEYRMFRTDRGMTALTELIPLLGGMDQGLALPSATWLLGLRMRNGFEFGVGPNVGLNGSAMMAGVGYTLDMGGINIPLNLAYGRGASQTSSIAFSTGFNL